MLRFSFMKPVSSVFICILAIAAIAAAQTPPARVTGTVSAIDAAGKQITVKSDKGDTVTLVATPRSFLKRVPPGETDLKKATDIQITDISAGDRVIGTYQTASDQKTLEARTIYIMSKADVAEVHQKEEQDWQRRGTTGIVTAADPASKVVTIKAGQREYKVQSSDKTEFFRYSPDSAQFRDAKPSTFADIKVGDQLRVLGDKSGDGANIAAEKVVSGAFRQIAATIKAVNASTGELTVTDLATKKPLTIKVNSDSTMKKLPEPLAQMLARRYGAGRVQGGPGGEGAGAEGGGRRSGGPGGLGGRGGDIGQMIDRLPAIAIADLKTGDAIMVQTTIGSDQSRPTAVTLLAGVEPILTAAPNSTRDLMGSWNLGGGGGEGQ
jgi:Cu/Ag efflux protein CusF